MHQVCYTQNDSGVVRSLASSRTAKGWGRQNEKGSEQRSGVVVTRSGVLYATHSSWPRRRWQTIAFVDTLTSFHSSGWQPVESPMPCSRVWHLLTASDKMAHVFSRSARHPTCALQRCIVIRYSATIICMPKGGGGCSASLLPIRRPKKKKKKSVFQTDARTHNTGREREREMSVINACPQLLRLSRAEEWYANTREGG